MESTMLIIDDVEINREVLKVLFAGKYAILEAEGGEEALMILERCQGSIDIVLLDLMMPGMSGIEMLELRKEIDYFRNIPVVVITGSGAMEDQIKAFELGASDFVNKPFIPEIVITRVDNVMASHRRMLSIELEAQKLKVKSELDQMTGLYNKTTSEIMIDDILQSGTGKLNVLFVIDIDNFKSVNDISGHTAGDHVIKIVADLISSLFRKTDIVGRIGGDEFVTLMVDVSSMDIVYTKVNELIQIMKYKPNLTIPENVTLSIGIASNEKNQTSYKELFRKADEALYNAKEGGKASYREYGVTPITIEHDERPVALLISRNRSVCSIVHALVPPELRIVEVLTVEDLACVKKSHIEKIAIVYADVSDIEDNASDIWKEIKHYTWIDFGKVFAICQEGNMPQYGAAFSNGVTDILAAPIDGASFKRRTMEHLKKIGIAEAVI